MNGRGWIWNEMRERKRFCIGSRVVWLETSLDTDRVHLRQVSPRYFRPGKVRCDCGLNIVEWRGEKEDS